MTNNNSEKLFPARLSLGWISILCVTAVDFPLPHFATSKNTARTWHALCVRIQSAISAPHWCALMNDRLARQTPQSRLWLAEFHSANKIKLTRVAARLCEPPPQSGIGNRGENDYLNLLFISVLSSTKLTFRESWRATASEHHKIF